MFLTGCIKYPNTESPIQVINKTVWSYWKCCHCENYLTVGPLSLTPDGKDLCGRCVNHWAEMNVEETLVRNWKLENIIKEIGLPCTYYDVGCKRALKWGEVREHEGFCVHRSYNCPATPYDSCQTVLPAKDLYNHFEEKHPEFLLTAPEFKDNLQEDSIRHR